MFDRNLNERRGRRHTSGNPHLQEIAITFPPRVQSVNRGEANAVNYLEAQQQGTQSTGCRGVYQPRARGAPATSAAQSIQKGECEWLERTGFN